MSSLIPFQNRPQTAADQLVGQGSANAQIVDVSSHASRIRDASVRRRPRRDWDPAFHVDLLTF